MAHLKPFVHFLTVEEAKEELADILEPEDLEELTAGYYGRLSAPGYLDCTDWHGPFDTAEEALDYVCDIYDVDEDGELVG